MSTFSSNTDAAAIETARILLDIKAVNLRPEKPYSLTAGWASPVLSIADGLSLFLKPENVLLN